MIRAACLIGCLLLFTCGAWSQDSQYAEETITIFKSDFETLKARVDRLEEEIQRLKGNPPASPLEEALPTEATTDDETSSPAPDPTPAGGRHLALPDISLITQAKGKVSSDTRDDNRNRIQLSEAELSIQGDVYPNVKADASITASPAEDEPMQVEEAYLSYLGALKGLNLYVGKKHVAFGRTNLLHSHS